MIQTKISRLLAICLFAFSLSISCFAQNEHQTFSPYFLVKSDKGGVDQLPLKSTSAQVNIAGVIADVVVDQVYQNEGKSTLEAIYTFPASTRAAVYGMKMTIGNRTITAEIRERSKAKAEYEAAKSSGKTASLLEQERPNVFTMNVANIQPGDIVKVELRYTELLVPESGVYEFVYPTVVGPRYVAPGTQSDAKFAAHPYLPKGEKAPYDVNINVHLEAGLPLQDIRSPSHQVSVQHPDLKSAAVSLQASETNPGNRDYILRYQLAGKEIQSGLLLYEHNDEKFFLAMLQPPQRPTIKDIPPREYIFIVDVSGSMGGHPLSIAKKLLRNLITNLRPTDRFNVILFAGTTAQLHETSVLATPENLQKAINVMDKQRGGGSTQLLPALSQSLHLPRQRGLSRSFVIVTDGYVTVEKAAFDLIRNNLDQANFFPFGIGSSVNRFLMEGMAHVGMTEPFIVSRESEAAALAEKFRTYIQTPVMTQVKARFEELDVYDVSPVSIPDVLAERPVLIYGKYRGEAKGKIAVAGYSGNQVHTEVLNVTEYAASQKNSAIRYLWAREKIRLLDDYGNVGRADAHAEEITQLGLDYNLLTAYTSFIAVDNRIVKKNGKAVTVQQASPLPEYVENSAVGFDFGIEQLTAAKQAVAKLDEVTPAPLCAGNLTVTFPIKTPSELRNWINAHLPKVSQTDLHAVGSARFTLQLSFAPDGALKTVKVRGAQPEFARHFEAMVRNWSPFLLPAQAASSFNLTFHIAI